MATQRIHPLDEGAAAFRIRGLTRADFTAWKLPGGAELLRAANPAYPFARARHEMALALHLCLARGPGRLTRHVGEERELPPPRVGLLTLSPGATDLVYEAEARTEMLTLSLPHSAFAAIGAQADAAFARGLRPFREEALRAALLGVLERAPAGASERLYLDHALAFLAAGVAAPRLRPVQRALGPARLKHVIAAIEAGLDDHPGEPPSLASLAHLVGLSTGEFARGFRAATGESPHAYLTRRRIERAQALLRGRPGLLLADLALSLGFADQAHFSRRFRQVVGTTPARFRRGA